MQGFTWYELWTRILPDWLTAAGTIGAAVAAVWLGLRDGRVRLRVSVGIYQLVTAGDPHLGPDYLVIEVTNIGRRPAHLTLIGWQVGLWPFRQYAMQNLDPHVAPDVQGALPTILADGQSTQFVFLLDKWLLENGDKLFGRARPRRSLQTLFTFATVSTSTGKTFRRCIDRRMRSALSRARGVST